MMIRALLAGTALAVAGSACAAAAERPNKTQWVLCWDGSKVKYGKPCPDLPPPPEEPHDPAPTEPEEPAPTEPAPTEPTEPAPHDPAPTDPEEPAPEEPTEPVPVPSTGWEPSPTLAGREPIKSNFDESTALVPAWGTGELPKSAAPDVVGAFRFICRAGQLLPDDPIVYPGQPGASHLHQFFGNLAADAHSTYESLRTTGDGTCGDPVNRSAYWIPAMLNGTTVVKPNFISIYYKRRPLDDPRCQGLGTAWGAEGKCVRLPHGLKFIFGYDMLTGKTPTGNLWFDCNGVKLPNLENCTATTIGAVIQAPDCWDGKNLDSPNHRDHVSYAYYDQNSGQKTCPTTHPYVIPTFTLGAWYSVPAGATLSLSSDMGRTPGSTFHADFWMAWSPTVHAMWEDNCLNKLLNCSGGDLGNGLQIRNAW